MEREVSSVFLEVNNVNTYYSKLHAIWDISFTVEQGEIVTLIGSNGAGKSTLLKTISGTLSPKVGSIVYNGNEIAGAKASKIVRQGLVLCPEGRQIFPKMTVLENLRMGAYTCKNKTEIEEGYERNFALFPKLKERVRQEAGTLSGGEQQMLAIARALMSNPKLLMLDEPSLGLSPVLTEMVFQLLQEINKQGVTILLVEQNAVMAPSIANHGYLLSNGHITASGTGKELLSSDEVLAGYLG